MISLPHQVPCEPSDYRPSQAYFSGVTLLTSVTVALKLTHVPIVAVCTYPDLKGTFYRLLREVLLHTGSSFEGHHCLINRLLPMRPVIGTAGSHNGRYYWPDLPKSVNGTVTQKVDRTKSGPGVQLWQSKADRPVHALLRSAFGCHNWTPGPLFVTKSGPPSEKWTGCSFRSLARLWGYKSITNDTFMIVLCHDGEFRLFCYSHHQPGSWPRACYCY